MGTYTRKPISMDLLTQADTPNLETDPLEQRDLAGDESTLAIQKKLFARLLELQQDVGDKLDLEANFFGG